MICSTSANAYQLRAPGGNCGCGVKKLGSYHRHKHHIRRSTTPNLNFFFSNLKNSLNLAIYTLLLLLYRLLFFLLQSTSTPISHRKKISFENGSLPLTQQGQGHSIRAFPPWNLHAALLANRIAPIGWSP